LALLLALVLSCNGPGIAQASPDPGSETLRPSSAGDEENISNATSGVGNHWKDVDDTEPDGDTSKVWTDNWRYQRDLYNVQNHSLVLVE